MLRAAGEEHPHWRVGGQAREAAGEARRGAALRGAAGQPLRLAPAPARRPRTASASRAPTPGARICHSHTL
eukprot:601491-Rhodomonas_salina.1